jgi:hypothetical protein
VPAVQLLAGLFSRRFDALVGDWDVRHSGECHLERRHRPVPLSRRDIVQLWAGTVMSVPDRSHVERSSVHNAVFIADAGTTAAVSRRSAFRSEARALT